MTTPHSNQKKAAKEVIMAFKKTHYVMLMAQMQSGKTLTSLKVAKDIPNVRSVYIISGDNSFDLSKQWSTDTHDYKDPSKKYTVCFRNYLDIIPRDTVDSIFIWDESHTAQ